MSFTRPVIYPVWATEDVVDPVSGQNNVVTPPTEKQTNGWDLSEFPPRQWFNWLGRYTYEWIAWLDQQQQAQQTLVANAGNSYTVQIFPNVTVGGLALLAIVDQGAATNFYQGTAYIPPSPGSPVTLNTIASSVLTVSTISITGVVTVSGGTGPYLLVGTLNNAP